MLRRAGYVDVGERDATAEYLETVPGWIAATEPVRDLVAEVDGADEVDERLQGWRDAVEMIGRGWLRRSIYWGMSPVARSSTRVRHHSGGPPNRLNDTTSFSG